MEKGEQHEHETMAPSFVKAFTVHLSKDRRRELKYKITMSACTLLSETRYLYATSASNPLCDLIESRMERLVTVFTDEFLRRCRSVSKTRRERRYVATVVRKHVTTTINFSFARHVERLNRIDTLNILNDTEHRVPRFLVSAKVERWTAQVDKINKKLKTQVTI